MNRLIYVIKRPLAAVIMAAFSTTGIAVGEPLQPGAPGNIEKFEAVKSRLTDEGFKGVFAIAGEEGEIFFAGIGEQAAASGQPDEKTLVDMGSITKTFTAAAALKLIDAGALTTADRLSKYYPNAPQEKAGITVHQLLTHTSGLPGAVAADDAGLSKEDFIQRAMAAELSFEPGAAYQYSNVGYSLVAAIIENISGLSYETFIRETVLEGVGAPSIGYEAPYDSARSLLAASGQDIAAFSWGGASHWALIGNGGMIATAHDIIRFRRKFMAGEIVSHAAVNFAQSPHVREGENAPSHYGYGMVVEDHPWFGRVYWHNGGNEQFLANWTHYADHGWIVFTATNSPAFDADLAGLVIAEALFDRKILPDE